MQIIRPMNFAALGLGAAFVVVWGAVAPTMAFAEIMTVEADDTYLMGDGMEERMDVAQTMAIAKATQRAAEKAGVFVESFSATQMGSITQDEVRAISATVLEVQEPVKVIPEVVAGGQAIRYHAYVVAVVDTSNISRILSQGSANNEDIVRKNKEYEEELAKVHAEIERLREEYRQASESEKQRINEEVKQNENEFMANEREHQGWQWYRKGLLYDLMAGGHPDYNKAMEYYQKAIEIYPECDFAWARMGEIYDEWGNLDKAIECKQKALAYNSHPEPIIVGLAWFNIGRLFDKAGNYEEAIEHYQKAVEIFDYVMAWNNMGVIYNNQENYEKALECLQRATQIDAKRAVCWNNLGTVYWNLNLYRDALTAYEHALALDPDNAQYKKDRDDAAAKL